jgi:ATP dependent DNA ligase C terminal region
VTCPSASSSALDDFISIANIGTMLPRPPDADVAPVKAVHKGKFPVVGFVKDPSGVAALYLGKQEGKDLVYMGKVGTGWSRTVSSQIRKQLDTVVSPKSKLTRPIRKPKATWVEPKFYADVEYRDITSEGLLRASSFKGLIKGTGAHLTSPFLCPLLSVKPT